jgi:hypothetical protein
VIARLLLPAALLLAPIVALADDTMPPAPFAYRQLSDPAKEAKAKALMETLRCLVCQSQSIADSMLPSRATCAIRSACASTPGKIPRRSHMADPALWRLRQLCAASHRRDMAVVCCAIGADRGGRRCDAPPFREGEGGMTWLLIAALALVVLLVLTFIFRTPRKGWEAIASALVLGLAGYALQGHPGQAGQPHDEVAKSNIFATTLVDERQKVVGATVQVSSWEMVADALMRHGDYADAATMLKGAVEKTPKQRRLAGDGQRAGGACRWLALAGRALCLPQGVGGRSCRAGASAVSGAGAGRIGAV